MLEVLAFTRSFMLFFRFFFTIVILALFWDVHSESPANPYSFYESDLDGEFDESNYLNSDGTTSEEDIFLKYSSKFDNRDLPEFKRDQYYLSEDYNYQTADGEFRRIGVEL